MTAVLLALTGLADESELVRVATGADLTVIRRCVDAVDLLGAAASDQTCPVVIASTLPRLTPDVIARLGHRVVVGLAADALGTERLSRLGVDPVIVVSPAPATTMQQVADVCQAGVTPIAGDSPEDYCSTAEVDTASGSAAAASWPAADARPQGGPVRDQELRARMGTGSVVTVWGPMGAPGRTTVAIGLAEALSDRGLRVCLVDADTYAPSVAMALGLVEETSGMSVACRQAEAGTLSPTSLASLTMSPRGAAHSRWRVLGGIAQASRWPDVRSAALDRLWQAARASFDMVVVDAGFCLEEDDSPGAWARQRNAAALSATAQADRLVVVADGSGLGAARLLAGWSAVDRQSNGIPVTLVRNRARGSGRAWHQAVASCGIPDVVDIPDDPRSVQGCWDRGHSLGEGARRSRVRRAMVALAARVSTPLSIAA